MSQNKKNSFKHVIKKSFILYSLVPITIITLIFYNMLIISFSKWSYKDNRDMNEYISQLLEYELSEYKNDIIELSSNEDTINILLNKQSDSKNIFENIYDKINRKKIKSIFHIYNIKGESV
ncbi:MAG: two-component sensor histidine kinase, partial [Clostridium butyricum]|nr:two-component sensor histidine kinase [Clostridium butyricum]